jgi:acetyl esterase/lipase
MEKTAADAGTMGMGMRLQRAALRLVLKPVLGERVPVAIQRRWLSFASRGTPPPRGTRCTPLRMNGVAAERVEHGSASPTRAILYLHGGGYCIGSPATHRVITGHLAKATGATVYAPDYRLAPEHPHPAALEDALSAYRWLLAQGLAPGAIVLAGDSAGGGLALACTLALRDAGEPLPAALALISPWVDLAGRSETMTSHARRDPLLTPQGLQRWAWAYVHSCPVDHPACSPLYADLHGLPPLLIQVGSEEVLLGDSRRLHQHARDAGVNSQLHEYDGLWHDFPLHAGLLPGADAAIAEIRDFLKRYW